MHLKLRIVGGKHAGQEIAVQGEKFLIGRGEDCHLRPSSDSVSRRHCEIRIDGQATWITDLNSSNGTLVNGARISGDYKLNPGDQLRIGPLRFDVVIVPSVPASELTATRVHIFPPGDVQPQSSSPIDAIMGWLTDGVGVSPHAGTVEMNLDETYGKPASPTLSSSGVTMPGVGQTTASSVRTMHLPPLPVVEKIESKDAGDAASEVIGNLRSTIKDKQRRTSRRTANE